MRRAVMWGLGGLALFGAAATAADIQVGPRATVKTLAGAVAIAQPGDRILLQPGEYLDDFAEIERPVTIRGEGGRAHLRASGLIPNGKAILIVRAPAVVIENLEFSGAAVPDKNGAGIRWEAGDLTVRDSLFHDNENGILSGAIPDGHALIERCEFAANGAGDGQSHGAYFGAVARLRVIDSQFHDTLVGSHLKSRAANTLVVASGFIDGRWGTANYAVDLPNGGHAEIRDSVFERAVTTSNRAMIHFGGETDAPAGRLLVTGNRFASERPLSTGVLNQTALPVEITGNRFVAVRWVAEGGPTEQHNNQIAEGPAPGAAE